MLLFGLLLFIGGVICTIFFVKSEYLWWGLLISFGVFLLFVIICLMVRGCNKTTWLKRRQRALQHILDSFNKGYLQEKHCHVNVGPYGSYLKFIFTVSYICKNRMMFNQKIAFRTSQGIGQKCRFGQP